MKTALAIIDQAEADQGPGVLAFSGGGDSTVLLDIFYRSTPYRPALVFVDTGMEYPETRAHVEKVAADYGAELHIAEAPRAPLDQWRRYGYAFLGKMAARGWTKGHPDAGFRLDVSTCCRNMKIKPGRDYVRKTLAASLQYTAQRGGQDDQLRGLRALKDGATHYVKADKLTVCNPLIGWTDLMIRRYTRARRLPRHPARARGALTIGCVYCGGGAQFTNSGLRVLRHTWPEAWRRFMVEDGAGLIVLALKYDTDLETTRDGVDRLGGLAALADSRPWVFDYTRLTPLAGYDR